MIPDKRKACGASSSNPSFSSPLTKTLSRMPQNTFDMPASTTTTAADAHARPTDRCGTMANTAQAAQPTARKRRNRLEDNDTDVEDEDGHPRLAKRRRTTTHENKTSPTRGVREAEALMSSAEVVAVAAAPAAVVHGAGGRAISVAFDDVTPLNLAWEHQVELSRKRDVAAGIALVDDDGHNGDVDAFATPLNLTFDDQPALEAGNAYQDRDVDEFEAGRPYMRLVEMLPDPREWSVGTMSGASPEIYAPRDVCDTDGWLDTDDGQCPSQYLHDAPSERRFDDLPAPLELPAPWSPRPIEDFARNGSPWPFDVTAIDPDLLEEEADQSSLDDGEGDNDSVSHHEPPRPRGRSLVPSIDFATFIALQNAGIYPSVWPPAALGDGYAGQDPRCRAPAAAYIGCTHTAYYEIKQEELEVDIAALNPVNPPSALRENGAIDPTVPRAVLEILSVLTPAPTPEPVQMTWVTLRSVWTMSANSRAAHAVHERRY